MTRNTLLRQWQMLRQIPRYPAKITTRDLMERLAADSYRVSKRTVERDLMALSEVFPLLSDEREKPFGWSWEKNAVPLDVPSLGNSEALAFALIARYLQGLLPGAILAQLEPYFLIATSRLANLPAGAPARTWPEKVRIVQPTQPLLPPKIQDAVQRAVSDALLEGTQLAVRYRPRAQGKAQDYTLHPLGLVQRGQVSYLVATAFDYGDIRIYALHRMEAAAPLEVPAGKPRGFDLDEYIRGGAFGWGEGKNIRLVANFRESAAEHLHETPLSEDQKIVPTEDGWVRVSATVANTPQLEWWLTGFGAAVEVLQPAALKKIMRVMVTEMALLYRIG